VNQLAAIAYVSSATSDLSVADLEALLLSARAQNARARITGVLLHHDGSFFQYLEGPEAEVRAVYARIKTARQHCGLIELMNRRIEARCFEDWKMGFSRAPKSLVLQLSQASWATDLSQELGKENKPSGIKLLLEFWRNAVRGT
jgi:hypothetical protein